MKAYILTEQDLQGYGNGTKSADIYPTMDKAREEMKRRLINTIDASECEHLENGSVSLGHSYAYISDVYYLDIFEVELDSIIINNIKDNE